jgi:hypothetical protein
MQQLQDLNKEDIMEENMNIEDRIHSLVKEQFSKMKMSKKYSNQARLANACEHIVYHEWGFFNNNIQKLINKYVEQYIPDDMD